MRHSISGGGGGGGTAAAAPEAGAAQLPLRSPGGQLPVMEVQLPQPQRQCSSNSTAADPSGLADPNLGQSSILDQLSLLIQDDDDDDAMMMMNFVDAGSAGGNGAAASSSHNPSPSLVSSSDQLMPELPDDLVDSDLLQYLGGNDL